MLITMVEQLNVHAICTELNNNDAKFKIFGSKTTNKVVQITIENFHCQSFIQSRAFPNEALASNY